MFPLTYAYNVQVHRTTMLLPFNLAITLPPPGPVAIARPASPDVGEIGSLLAYRLHLIHRSALLRKMADANFNKAQARFKNNYDMDVRFEPRFSACDYVFVGSHPLMASAADCMAFRGYAKLLLQRMGPYQVISAGPEHSKIDQNNTRNIISINLLARAAKEGKLSMNVRSDSRKNADINLAK